MRHPRHPDPDRAITRLLHRLDRKLAKVLAQGATLMATTADIETAITRIATDVTAVIAKIKDLQSQIASGGVMTQADADRIASELGVQADTLDAVLTNPTVRAAALKAKK